MSKYKMYKVFDCQNMPNEILIALREIFREAHNDSCVTYTIADSFWEEGTGKNYILLDGWLVMNGADGPPDNQSCGETVLIKYWW